MGKILALIAVVIGLLTASVNVNHNADHLKSIQVGETVLNSVEIANTDALREQGLSGRSSIEPNYGMLFVFESPDKYPFWMKDMNFPIDIIWLDKSLKVTGLKANAKPESYPESFGPEKESEYVLETQAGLIEKENIKIGDEVKFIK